jgi:gliding motility-associated-like protein
VSANSITPRNTFTGELVVKVVVNDGTTDSKSFDLKVQVNADASAPVITGQTILTIKEDETLNLALSHVMVTGGKNSYPVGFTLLLSLGDNYTFNGTTIKPLLNFSGVLSVNLKVTDGDKESAPFKLQVTVNPVNDPPLITGQVPLSTDKTKPITVEFSHLTVTDPDNKYPSGFLMEISGGSDYTVAGKTVTPSPAFTGQLEVGVTVNDGSVASNTYPVKISVKPTQVNVAPQITGQRPVSITQHSEYSIKLGDLTVVDPNNEKKYPDGYTLKVLPGDSYTAQGTTVKPVSNFAGSAFTVRVTVSDGIDTSSPFNFKIGVVPPSSIPKVIGQQELSVSEDSTLTLSLTDLIVTDADNGSYPKGFSLTVLPGSDKVYSATGNRITPASDSTGFIEVAIRVSDGVNVSEPYNVSILVTPVNDPPVISNIEQTALACEPGDGPVYISETIELADVDDDYLSLAEIGFRPTHYSAANDELIFSSVDSSKIRGIYDPKGVLFLVGYASVSEYRDAIRSIQYNYRMTQDENGNPSDILSGTRTLYIYVHDSQNESLTHERQISMETKVSLDIPSVFTPNGDKSNDTWHVRATNQDQLDESVIRVFDKRGVLLYEAVGFTQEWDGISNGQALPVDTYYYTIDLNLSYMKKTYKGAVTILH